MCGRYLRRSDKQHIAEAFRAGKLPADLPLPPDFNIAPTTFQPVVRMAREVAIRHGEPDRELALLRWGLIPFFTKTLDSVRGLSTINARAETVATSPSFREPFRKRRCLVPFDGFYEWKQLGPEVAQAAIPPVLPGQKKPPTARTAPPVKQPFVFTVSNGRPAAFAGLWDAWREPKSSPGNPDTWLQSFTILTTEANELMAPIHTRMPVILPERDWARWLDRDFGASPRDTVELQAMLRPFDADAMSASPCNPAVGNVRNNGPEMLVCPNPGGNSELLNSA